MKNRKRFPVLWLVILAVPCFGCLLVPFLGVIRLRNAQVGDPHLASAVQAQLTINAFIQRLQAAKPNERFAIKGRFSTSVGPEYLWVKNPVYKDNQFDGVLDQAPIAVPKLAKGDTVHVKRTDVVDWMYKDSDGAMHGGYSEHR